MKNQTYQAWRPFYTLLKKEIMRFLSVGIQTLAAPLVTASLYLLVFGVSMGQRISFHPEQSYLQFIVPGLIVMGVANNSFANTSSSLFMSRYIGYVVDYLLAPLSSLSFLVAHLLAAMIRGLTVGLMIWGVSMLFTSLPWTQPALAIASIVLISLLFSSLGVVAALHSKSFEHLSMFSNFLILPLIYVGGLFYPVKQLPKFWSEISQFNPIFYMIESFRHAVLGQGDITLGLALGVTGLFAAVIFMLAFYMIVVGQGLRKE